MTSTAAAQLTEPAEACAARLEAVAPLPAEAKHRPLKTTAGTLIRGGTIGLLVLVQLSWLSVIAYVMLLALR